MIYIHYNNGRVLHGVVLAFGERLVRVAVKGSEDAMEFHLVNHFWVSEDCEVVRLDFSNLAALPARHEADLMESFFASQSQDVSLQRVM
jgi:hypothetical protein